MPRPPDAKLMKCRYCEFTVLRYRHYKNGTLHHGHAKLQDHVLNTHYFADNLVDYGPYRDVLTREEEDWKADPATLGEDSWEEGL